MMSNLVLHVQGLDYCRFYAENMVHIQFENPLCPVPPDAPYNQPINDRKLHQLIREIDIAFDNAISRTDLEFPIGPILYRYRSLYGNYAAQYKDDLSPQRNTRVGGNTLILPPPVPEQGNDEDMKAFSYRFIKHTAEQVQSFIWMVCLDQYARVQTDEVLPSPPWAFEPPACDGAAAFLTAHHKILNDLMMPLMDTHSDTLDIHVSLRDYGLSTLLPLVAECRNVIYAAWTIPNAKGQKPTSADLPDDEEELFVSIPPMGPRFEQQAEWEKAATEIAVSFNLKAFVDDSDSAFTLIPRVYQNADDLMYWSEGPLTDRYVLDIAVSPIKGQPYLDLEVLLRSVGKTILERAVAHDCHVIARYIEQEDQIIGAVLRVRRNVDFPDSPQETMTHVEPK